MKIALILALVLLFKNSDVYSSKGTDDDFAEFDQDPDAEDDSFSDIEVPIEEEEHDLPGSGRRIFEYLLLIIFSVPDKGVPRLFLRFKICFAPTFYLHIHFL